MRQRHGGSWRSLGHVSQIREMEREAQLGVGLAMEELSEVGGASGGTVARRR